MDAEIAAAQRRLAESLARALGDTDWAEGSLFWAEIDGRVLARVETIDRAGQTHERPLGREVSTLARELRERMTSPDAGTWFSMSLELASTGALTWRFNFDRRAYDNPASPFTPGAQGAVPTDEAYARDVAAHPRDDRHTPLWLRRGAVSSAAPYDLLNGAWGWPGVFASVEQQSARALAARAAATGAGAEAEVGVGVGARGGAHDGTRLSPHRLTRAEAETLGRQVLTAVVADVLEPHRVATLLGLHAEAVSRRLLPPVPGAAELDPDVTLHEARQSSTPALLAVEAGVYGIVGDVVRAHLGA